MLIRAVKPEEQALFDQVVDHPLQTWSWGGFRKKTGLKVERLGFYENGKLTKGLQVTFHPIPLLNQYAGYLPKGFTPDEDQLAALKELGKQNQALFIKLEPNVAELVQDGGNKHGKLRKFLLDHDCQPGRPLFTQYTFQLDLTASEDQLFKNLGSKTRYNTRLAQKKGVEVKENSTQEGLDIYLDILKQTTSRQQFYAHSPEYFQQMWDKLGGNGMMRIFQATYQGKVLVSWIVFIFNKVLYYPYGASVREHREVMASNLMMWEIIRFGKKQGCTLFDMWGSLGPEPNKKNPWYGFHRLNKGRVLIIGAGTGVPYVTTDTGASLHALELHCDVLMKASKVKGIFDKDPQEHKDAKRFKTMIVANIPMKSAVVRSMPFLLAANPRKILPPPMTTATSTPMSWIVLIFLATASEALGSIPESRSPIIASPPTLSKILLKRFLACINTPLIYLFYLVSLVLDTQLLFQSK